MDVGAVVGFLDYDTFQILAVLFLKILYCGAFIGGVLQMLLKEL